MKNLQVLGSMLKVQFQLYLMWGFALVDRVSRSSTEAKYKFLTQNVSVYSHLRQLHETVRNFAVLVLIHTQWKVHVTQVTLLAVLPPVVHSRI